MALFREVGLRSRVGGSRGLNPSGENILVRVVAEKGSDADVAAGNADYSIHEKGQEGEVTVWPDPRVLVENDFAPLGSVHPWDATKRAVTYTVEQHLAPGIWHVRVHYQVPDALSTPPSTKWLHTVRTVSIPQRIVQELQPDFRTFPRIRGGLADLLPADFWTRPARSIGNPQYLPQPDPTHERFSEWFATHSYDGFDEIGPSGPQGLRQLDNYDDSSGANIGMPALEVTFHRTAPNWHASLNIELARYVEAINGSTFERAPPYHVLCKGATVDPISMEVPGQREEGVAYRMSAVFIFSFTPFVPFKVFSTYPDDRGFGATVFALDSGGNRVVDHMGRPVPESNQFRVVRREDFTRMMSFLSRGR